MSNRRDAAAASCMMTAAGPGGRISAEAAERRIGILSPLAAQETCSRVEARAASAALGLSERQVYNLIRRLRLADGHVGVLTRRGSRTTKGVTRLPVDMEAQLSRIIAEEARNQPPRLETGLFAAVVKRCRREMSPAPSASTIFRRLRNAKRGPLRPPAKGRRSLDEATGLLVRREA